MSVVELIKECEAIIDRVISKTNLDRYFLDDREEARQCLREIIIADEALFSAASERLRWVILYRRAIDTIRAAEDRISSDVPSDRGGGGSRWHDLLLCEAAEPPATPEQETAAREILAAAIDLSPREQQVLLDYAHGVPSQETGQRLGVSSGRVRQLVQRALGKMRRRM